MSEPCGACTCGQGDAHNILNSDHSCLECGSVVNFCGYSDWDYHYYCTNEKCANHRGEDVGDQEEPKWIKCLKEKP